MIYKEVYNNISDFLFEENPFNWLYGLSRSILAIGTFITLTFSDTNVLFDYLIYHDINEGRLFNEFNLFMIFGWDNLPLVKTSAALFLLITASGIYPRFTGVFQWWIASSFFYASNIVEGGDQINAIITFLLIPLTLLDNRKWHWNKSENNSESKKAVGNIIYVLIAIQMSMVYLNAVTDKMYADIEEWKLGNAIYYYLNDPYFGYPDWMDPFINSILSNSFFVSSLTWGTMFLELILFGVFFSNKKVKLMLFPAAVFFHLTIAVFLGLISFFMAMLGGLVIYLVPKDIELEPILSRLKYYFRKLFFKVAKTSQPEFIKSMNSNKNTPFNN